jgi:homoaconitase/3-isopropylmalate dehydratase large subunit
MLGAFGAFATGMGATDVAIAIALAQTWIRVPPTIAVRVHGKLPRGVYAKDLILSVIGHLGASGAEYRCLEFSGEGVTSLSMEERLVLTNMRRMRRHDAILRSTGERRSFSPCAQIQTLPTKP